MTTVVVFVVGVVLGIAIGLVVFWCWFWWLMTRGLWGNHWFRRHRRDMPKEDR